MNTLISLPLATRFQDFKIIIIKISWYWLNVVVWINIQIKIFQSVCTSFLGKTVSPEGYNLSADLSFHSITLRFWAVFELTVISWHPSNYIHDSVLVMRILNLLMLACRSLKYKMWQHLFFLPHKKWHHKLLRG